MKPGKSEFSLRRPRRALRIACCGCILFILAAGARSLRAQNGNSNGAQPLYPQLPPPALGTPDNIQPDMVAPAAPDSYIIGKNDLLTVFVYQMPELTRQVRVSSQGTIALPFVTQPFRAAGRTAPQLQQVIARRLLSTGIARDPMVQVIVRQVESKPIVIAGAVTHPMTLQAARPLPLLELLSRAGGLSSDAGDTVLVSRRAGAKTQAQAYNLVQLLRFGNPADNPLLDGGNMVTVLPARLVYVVGSFQRPGAFPLKMGEPITVIKAIALARGLKGTPNKGQAEIIETLADGSHRETRIHIGKIMRHKLPDPRLHAGDILYVPKDLKRQVLMTALTDAAQVLTLGVAYHFP